MPVPSFGGIEKICHFLAYHNAFDQVTGHVLLIVMLISKLIPKQVKSLFDYLGAQGFRVEEGTDLSVRLRVCSLAEKFSGAVEPRDMELLILELDDFIAEFGTNESVEEWADFRMSFVAQLVVGKLRIAVMLSCIAKALSKDFQVRILLLNCEGWNGFCLITRVQHPAWNRHIRC